MNLRAIKIFSCLYFLCAIFLSSCSRTAPLSQLSSISIPTVLPLDINSAIDTSVSERVIEPENVNKLQIIDQWGKGNVYGVALSPDETGIAVSTVTGVYIYDIHTLQEKQFIDLPIIPKEKWSKLPNKAISFSPDGKSLALGFEGITIWNLLENKMVRRIPNRIADYDIVQIAYSPKGDTIGVISMGTFIACDAWGGNFALYSVESGYLLYNDFFCPEAALFHFTFLNNGNVAFVGASAGPDEWGYEVSIINASTGFLIEEFRQEGVIDSISPDGSQISTRYDPLEYFAATNIIDLNTQNKIGEDIDGIVIYLTDNSKRLVQSENDWVITTSDNKEICHFESIPSIHFEVYRSVYTITGDLLIFWDYWRENVEVWDLEQCQRITQLFMPTGGYSLQYSNDGKILALTNYSDIHLFNGKNGKYSYTIFGHANIGPAQYFDFGKDSKTGVTVHNDKPYTITIWDLIDGKISLSIPTKFDNIQYVSLSPDEKIVATVDYEGVHLWNIRNLELITTIPGRFGNLSWNPDGSNFVLLDGNDLVFHNTKNGATEKRVSIPKDRFEVVFSKDWTYMAIIDEGRIELWDMNGHKFKDMMEYTPLVPTSTYEHLISVQFSPDNNLIAAFRYELENYSIRFWDTQTGVILRDVTIPFLISDMLFSPDGEKLLLFSEGVVYSLGVKVP